MARPRPHPLSWRSWPFRAVAGLILFTLLVRGVWGWWMAHKAAAELAKIRARGEPVRVEDVAFEPLADAQNAAVLLNQARAALVKGVDPPRSSNEDFPNYPPFPPAWHRLAGASEAAHGPVFVLVRQARGCPRAQFGGLFASAAIIPAWNTLRDLGAVVSDGAIYMHLQGNDNEAVERLSDAWHIAKSVRQDDSVISQLVALGIDESACQSAHIIAPGLRIGPPCTQPATRQQTMCLIQQLLDEEPSRQAFHRSLIHERSRMIDTAQAVADHSHAIRPLGDATILQTTRNMEIYIRAADCRDWPEAESTLKGISEKIYGGVMDRYWNPEPSTNTPRYSRWFADIGGTSVNYGPSIKRLFRIMAERRITAISLAARLYWLDHESWPDRLDDLVPQYLPAIPRDPFVSGDKHLGYIVVKGALPGGRDRPLVWYEAGPDRPSAMSPAPMYGWSWPPPGPGCGDGQRQYRDLSRFDPPPASTQAVDGNP